MGSLFLWEVKKAEFGSLGRFRIVLKGLICFRLDALHILHAGGEHWQQDRDCQG